MAPVFAFAARRRPLDAWLLRILLLLGALTLAFAAAAQQAAESDPPGRVARLNYAEGALSYAPEGSAQWTAAPYNRPLTDGDRLWTAERARAELDTGNALLRMDGQTSLVLSEIDDQTVRLQLTQGSLSFRISGLYEGDRFEVDTPQLAFVANRAGEYRIDVDPQRGHTEVTVLSGGATLYGERGETAEVMSGQRLAFEGRQLNPVPGYHSAGADSFDHWVAQRDRIADQSVAARYASPDIVGLSQLDQYGSWQEDGSYGPIWYPGNVAADWAPYRYGQWSYIQPWGWTWVDDAPWGFAPFHYGRWVQVGSRWGWSPGPVQRRVWYAPALVGFGGAGNVQWRPGSGPGGASWFPLAPGEPWRPGWRASQRYIDNVNRGIHDHHGDRRAPDRFVYAAQPGAITSIDHGRWEPGRPVRVGRPGGVGFAPPSAPFAPPPREFAKPWPVREQLPRDPLRSANTGSDDGWRGARHGRGGGDPVAPIQPVAPAIGAAAPALPLPLPPQPQLPVQRQVQQNDWRLYRQQQEAQQRQQQAQRQWSDPQRGVAEQEHFRRQQQDAFQRQQQERAQQEQFQQRQQQQYQWQQQQQQRAQQEQMREQMRQQQDQMRNQMQQQQMQQRAAREYQMHPQQGQREQQMRGQVVP